MHIHIFVSFNCLFSFAVSLKSGLRISCLEEAMEKRLIIFLSQEIDVIVHIFYNIKVLKLLL